MPFFNWLYKKAKAGRKKYIIDIPPMDPERQKRIIGYISDFAAKVIADSLAQMAKEKLDGN